MYLKIIIWEIRLDKLQQDIKQPFLTYPVWRMENVFKILQFPFHQNFLLHTDSLRSVSSLKAPFLISYEN